MDDQARPEEKAKGEAMYMKNLAFRTNDGYTLKLVDGEWTDWDVAYPSVNGFPVEFDGAPMSGGFEGADTWFVLLKNEDSFDAPEGYAGLGERLVVGEWRDSLEGPFEEYEEAAWFCQAEVGVDFRIVGMVGGVK